MKGRGLRAGAFNGEVCRMVATAVVLASFGFLLATALGLNGQQSAILAVWSVVIVSCVWIVARRASRIQGVKNSTRDDRVVVVRDDEMRGHPVGQIKEIAGQELAIIDLGPDVSRHLRRFIDDAIQVDGKPFQTGGVLNTACLPVLGAGSVMGSALSAGNVFLATANPATLMQIGAGVGSAVMGPTGVVAQAPFIAAGGAIIPVVAPVLLLTVISGMMISARLDRIQEVLIQLTSLTRQLLAQEIAEDCAVLVSAMDRVQDISDEFGGCGRFTDEIERRVSVLGSKVAWYEASFTT